MNMNNWSLESNNQLNHDADTNHTLPRYMKSYLIYGNYLPAHPFNLCLSQLAGQSDGNLDDAIVARQPLFITAQSRSDMIKALTAADLAKVSGSGRVSSLLTKIRIYYPETAHHWMLLLSLLHVRNSAESNDVRQSPLGLDCSVSMVVLHEPSAYFRQRNCADGITATDQYLRLITAGLAFAQSLQCGDETPPLVVFDSKITELQLPVLTIAGLTASDEAHAGQTRSIFPIAKQYFDWACEIT